MCYSPMLYLIQIQAAEVNLQIVSSLQLKRMDLDYANLIVI